MSTTPKSVLIVATNGTESMELCGPYDILKRAGASITLAKVRDPTNPDLSFTIKTAEGLRINCDCLIEQITDPQYDMIICPGGIPGAGYLGKCEPLINMLINQKKAGKHYCAICASPIMVFQENSLLEGEVGTCHPGMHEQLRNKERKDERVVVSNKCITSQGPCTAMEFGFMLCEELYGKETADKLREQMLYAEPEEAPIPPEPTEEELIAMEVALFKNVTEIKKETNMREQTVTAMLLLQDGKHVVMGTQAGVIALYEIDNENFTLINEVPTSESTKQRGQICDVNSIIEISNNRIVVASSLQKILILETEPQLSITETFTDCHSDVIIQAFELAEGTIVSSSYDRTVLIHQGGDKIKIEDEESKVSSPSIAVRISPTLFGVYWSEPNQPKLRFYDAEGKEQKLLDNQDTTVANQIFVVPEGTKRLVKDAHLAIAYYVEKEESSSYIKLIQMAANESWNEFTVEDEDKMIRCKGPNVFCMFKEKYILHAGEGNVCQIDIDLRKVMKYFEVKGDFFGKLLGMLPGNEVLVCDNEIEVDSGKTRKAKSGGDVKIMKNRQGLTMFKVEFE